MGNYVSMKSEVVITSGKVGQAESIRVGKNMAKYFNLYLTVSAYDRKATLFVANCMRLRKLSKYYQKKILPNGHEPRPLHVNKTSGVLFQSRIFVFPIS